MPDFFEPRRDIFPGCILPDNPDQTVWRYMDIDKFNSMLDNRALYMCRADRLERFEGTFSRQQILEMEDWFRSLSVHVMVDTERERRRNERRKTYINCWCVGDCDLDLMWKGYIRNPPGVAIKSNVNKLVDVCDKAVEHWPLDISIVNYFDHEGGEYIDSFVGTPTTFFHKDIHFKLDNELRIINWPNIAEPTPEHIFIPVDLAKLILEVVMQPGAATENVQAIRRKLDDTGLNGVPVSASRDDRELVD